MYNLIHPLDKNNTVALHGTSLEAAIHLLDTGVFDYDIKNSNTDPGYLYFVPIGKHFKDREVYREACTWKESMYTARIYAKIVTIDHYTQSTTGFRPENIGEISTQCDWHMNIEMFLLPEFEQHGFDRKYLEKFLKDLKSQKGVVLGFNKRLFELDIIPGKDEPDREIRIHLPKGISIDYVSGIYPIGRIEKEALRT